MSQATGRTSSCASAGNQSCVHHARLEDCHTSRKLDRDTVHLHLRPLIRIVSGRRNGLPNIVAMVSYRIFPRNDATGWTLPSQHR